MNFLLSLVVALSVVVLSLYGGTKRLEVSALDLAFHLRQSISTDPHITIIEVSDADIQALGRWPWKRTWHAAMARALKDFGAKSIYFDMLFTEPSDQEDDQALEEALRYAGNVYLPLAFDATSNKPSFPIPGLASSAKGLGIINIFPDVDGVFRRIPMTFYSTETTWPNVALKMAADEMNMDIVETIHHNVTLLPRGEGTPITIPLDDANNFLINWTGMWKDTFKHYSFIDVLASYKEKLEGRTPQLDIDAFKDNICLVAVTAIGLYDIKPIPLEPSYPSVGMLANVISNILHKQFLKPVPSWLDWILILVLALIAGFVIKGKKPLSELLTIIAIGVVYFAISYFFFAKGIVVNYGVHLFGLFLGGTVIGIYNFARVSIERQNFFKMAVTDGLTGLYNIRYFKMLLETEITMAQVDPTKRFAIAMTDVDHFKKFNDTYGHQVGDLVLKEVSAAIKKAARSSDIVARYGGEEMIVLFRSCPPSETPAVAEKLRKSIDDAVVRDEQGKTYHVTASVGISAYKPNDDVETMIKRADEGLYKAKEAGRNQVASADPDIIIAPKDKEK